MRFRATAIAAWIGGLTSCVAVLFSGSCGGTVAGEHAPEDAGTENGSDAPGGPDATVDVQPLEDGGGDLNANADAGSDASTRDVNAVDGDAGGADALADARAAMEAGATPTQAAWPVPRGATDSSRRSAAQTASGTTARRLALTAASTAVAKASALRALRIRSRERQGGGPRHQVSPRLLR